MAKIRKVTRSVGGATTHFTLNYTAARDTRYQSIAGGFHIGMNDILTQHAEGIAVPSPFFLSPTEAEALAKLDTFIAGFEKEKITERKVIVIYFERSSRKLKSLDRQPSWRQFTDEAKIEYKYVVLIERKLGAATTYYQLPKKGEKELETTRVRNHDDTQIVEWSAAKENKLAALYERIEAVGEALRVSLKELGK